MCVRVQVRYVMDPRTRFQLLNLFGIRNSVEFTIWGGTLRSAVWRLLEEVEVERRCSFRAHVTDNCTTVRRPTLYPRGPWFQHPNDMKHEWLLTTFNQSVSQLSVTNKVVRTTNVRKWMVYVLVRTRTRIGAGAECWVGLGRRKNISKAASYSSDTVLP